MNEPNPEETIFAAARQLPPADRAAYLNQACGDNGPLRRRIEALLNASEQSGAFLEISAAPALRRTPAASIPLAEKPGDKVGRYKLLQQIGEGGCGVVYMAEQEEPVRRRVALKIIKLGMDTKSVIARFEAERQALAMMDHPNIAKVFDAGATETGRPYFVMELVRGMKITDYCDENNLSTRQRLDLFIQVCQAIQHAHQKGIIHRDIKPSNILVTINDGVPVPKVIDFGIAKATGDQRLTDETIFTAFEQFIGTPAYMSPDQAVQTSQDIDTRSDIYALGVLLYELLTDKTPFDPTELLAVGLHEMRRTICEKEPERPSSRVSTMPDNELSTTAQRRGLDAPKLVSQLRGDLDWIVMKCLEKDRNRRYETANGLAADLRRHVNNEPVLARPPSNMYRFQKLVRRNRLAVGAGVAVAMSLILGLAISSFLFIREKKAHQQAEDARNQAQAAAARAEAASLETKTTLSASEFLQGCRLISEGHSSEALAYLARSSSDNPSNGAAITRMTTLLTSHCWMLPTVLLKPANSAQFSPDGRRILTTPFKFTTNMPVKRQAADSAPDSPGVAWSRTLAGYMVDGTTRVWDAQSGQPLTQLPQNGEAVDSAQFSPDGKRIVTASGDTARVWDAQSGQPLTGPLQHGDSVNSAQFSPDGKRIVTASRDKTARVWDAQSGQPLTEALQHADSVDSAQFSPDGSRIVTVSGNLARVWDAQNGKLLTEALRHSGSVNSAQFSPDGKRVVTASEDKTARMWNAQSGQPLTGPLKHDGAVISARFNPDGTRIVTASEDKTAQVWDAQDGQPLTESLKHGGSVVSAQFSPDGKRIVTMSRDGTARVWEMQSGPPLAETLEHGSEVNSAHWAIHLATTNAMACVSTLRG